MFDLPDQPDPITLRKLLVAEQLLALSVIKYR